MILFEKDFDVFFLLQIKNCGDVLGFGKSSSVFQYGSELRARISISKSRSGAASRWIRHYGHRGKNQVSQNIKVNHDQEFESMFKPLLGLVRNSEQSRTSSQSVLCRKNVVANNTGSLKMILFHSWLAFIFKSLSFLLN